MSQQRTIWAQKRFLAYAAGLGIDRLGNSVYSVVLPLVVFSLTESVLDMGTMAVVQFLPRAVCAIFIGALVDKMNRRTVILSALVFQGLCSGAIALLYQLDALEVWMLYVAGACISIGFEFSRTAEIAVVPVMFASQRIEATAALASVFTATLLLGPLLGAWLLANSNYEQLFWMNAASYLGPVLLCGISQLPTEVHGQPIRSISQVTESIKEGASFLLKSSDLTRLFKVILTVGLATSGLQIVLIYFLKHEIAASDSGVATFMAVGGLGMLAGSFWIGKAKNVSRTRLLRQCFGIISVAVLLLITENIVVMVLGQFLLSAALLAYVVVEDVIVQDRVPNQMMGRVGGFLRLLSHLTVSISVAASAALVSFVGAKGMFLVAATVSGLGLLVSMRDGYLPSEVEVANR